MTECAVMADEEVATRQNMIIQDLVALSRRKAQAASQGHLHSIDLLHDALASTLELLNMLNSDVEPMQATARLCQEHGVRMDGRTKNPFIPLLKIVFGVTHERSNISRNAAALKYACDHGIAHDDLGTFFKTNGGIARCAALESKERRALSTGPTRVSSSILAALGSRRREAPAFTLPATITPPSEGLLSLLIERGADGEYRLLGTSVETERSVRRYFTNEQSNAQS
jgi:hypothetical protein